METNPPPNILEDFNQLRSRLDQFDIVFSNRKIPQTKVPGNVEDELILNLSNLIKENLVEKGQLEIDVISTLNLLDLDQNKLKDLEKYLDLDPTSESLSISILVENFKRTFYTKNCFSYHSPDFIMMEAVFHGHFDVIYNIPSCSTTALDIAVFCASSQKNREAVKYLLSRGASIFSAIGPSVRADDRKWYDEIINICREISEKGSHHLGTFLQGILESPDEFYDFCA